MQIASRVAGALVVAVIAVVALTTLLPPLAGYDRYLVEDASMAPAIPRGSIVLARRAPVSELEKNDVITFTRPGARAAVTRRIVSADRDGLGRRVFWTKGDADVRPERKPVHFESTEQPRASFHLPHAGWLLIALEDPQLRLLLLGALALGLAAATLPPLLREGAAVSAPGADRRRARRSVSQARDPQTPVAREEHGAASA